MCWRLQRKLAETTHSHYADAYRGTEFQSYLRGFLHGEPYLEEFDSSVHAAKITRFIIIARLRV